MSDSLNPISDEEQLMLGFQRRYDADRLRVSRRPLRDSARVRRWLHAGTERSLRYRRYQHAERATGHQTSGREGDSVRLETIIGTWNHPPMPSVVKMAPCRFRGCEKFVAKHCFAATNL
jgi:hypothetical protein